MIEEALQWLKDNTQPVIFEAAGQSFSTADFNPIEIKRDLPGALKVTTLSGLSDLVTASFEGITNDKFVAHIVSPTQVDIVGLASDEHGRRKRFATAEAWLPSGLQVGVFQDHNEFMLLLQRYFVPNDDVTYLLTLCANLTDEKAVTSTDDGLTQTVGTRSGVRWQSTTAVKPRVSLAPFRTFTEVAQPESIFVLRMQSPKEPGIPKLGLFDADGGAWRKQAIDNIARNLSVVLKDMNIIS